MKFESRPRQSKMVWHMKTTIEVGMRVTIFTETDKPFLQRLTISFWTKSGAVRLMKPNLFGLLVLAAAALLSGYLSRPRNLLVAALGKRLIFGSSNIEGIIDSGASIVRWGDGDTMSALQISNNFEGASKALSRDLLRLFKKTKGSRLLLGVPRALLTSELRANYPQSRLRIWNPTLLLLVACIRRRTFVVDSLMFRSSDQVASLAAAIEHRSVILVAPSVSQELIRNRLGLSEVCEILVSETDNYSRIKDTARAVIDAAKDVPSPLVLISGGSGGRILASMIFDRIQCVDIGHLR